MSTLATSAPVRTARALDRPRAALLLTAVLFTGTFLDGLLGHADTLHGLTKAADYVYTAFLPPICVTMLWTLVELRRLQAGRDGRLGLAGVRLVALALAGFFGAGVATIATASTDTQGPLYPLSLVVSLAGLALFAAGSVRGRVLPRWAGPALAVGWLVGFPTVTNVTVPVMVAVLVAVAAALPRDGQPTRNGFSTRTPA